MFLSNSPHFFWGGKGGHRTNYAPLALIVLVTVFFFILTEENLKLINYSVRI